MTPERAAEVSGHARRALAEIKTVRADTLNRVKIAYHLGISKTEISELSGLARSTIDHYLGHQPKRGAWHGR